LSITVMFWLAPALSLAPTVAVFPGGGGAPTGGPELRPMDRTLPVMLTLTELLLELAAYGSVPPDKVTCAVPVQLDRTTWVGLAVNAGGGHGPAPWPVRLTVTVAVVSPSDIPISTGEVLAGEVGFLRTWKVLVPARSTMTASLPDDPTSLPVPPAAVTSALEKHLVNVTVEGEATNGWSSTVPRTLETVTDIVCPVESRMVIGTFSAQVPLGTTSKLPPLEDTVSRDTEKAELGLVMV
jgi:hypothetical protein